MAPDTENKMLSNLRSLRVWTVLLPVIPAVIVVVACCAVMQGCGYTAASTLPQRYQTIHIPAARNSIKEYDLQAPLTNALIRKFTVDTRLRVVDAERADLQLETDIKGYPSPGNQHRQHVSPFLVRSHRMVPRARGFPGCHFSRFWVK